MANNRINCNRFFEFGGFCEVMYIDRGTNKWEIAYPKSVEEYNSIMSNALLPKCRFIWNRWVYKPLIEKYDSQGTSVFRYLYSCFRLYDCYNFMVKYTINERH